MTPSFRNCMIDWARHENLNEENWKKCDPEKRLESLKKLEADLASEQNRPSSKIYTYHGDDGDNGRYNCRLNEIEISNECIMNNNPRLGINTIAHESRHGYQHDCCDRRDAHPEVDDATKDEWDHNFKNYKSPKKHGQRQYEQQPIEVDARRFAQSVVEGYNEHQESTKKLNDLPPSASQSGGDETSPVIEHAAESRTEPSAAISAEHQAQIDRAQSMLPPPAVSATEPKTSVTQHTPEEQSAPIPKITPEHQAQIDKARSMLPPPPPPAASDENAQKTSLSQ